MFAALIPLAISLFTSLAQQVPKMIEAWKKTDEYNEDQEAEWQADWAAAIVAAGQVDPDPEP